MNRILLKSRMFVAFLLMLFMSLTHADNRGLSRTPIEGKAEEKRMALVIGNGDYANAPLKNPTNDAEDIAASLQALGFQVLLRTNLDRRQMRHAIRDFGKKIKNGGVGLFFFAGHGIQVKGVNYLIPVDTDIQVEDEVRDEAIEAESVLRKMESANNRLNIVILDACRNNPFARSFRSQQQGLAQMDAPAGSLIAYSTSPGDVANDGQARNSFFTEHLIGTLQIPGLSIEQVFKKVRVNVMRETQNKQIPWESSSLLGEFYFHPPRPGSATPTPPSPVADERISELSMWERIKQSDDPEDFKAYIRRYGEKGLFIRLAQQKLETIDSISAKDSPFSNDSVYDTAKYALHVNTVPANARVRILNIDPAYRPGIRLNPGRYHIEIAKPGYIKHREWIEMDDADRVLSFILKKGHRTHTPGKSFHDSLKDGSMGPQMMRIQGTCFQMGSMSSQRGRDRDERWHRVCVDDFSIGRYEVTFAEYDKFAEATGRHMPEDKGWGRGKRPVIGVSWNDALTYADWLSEQTGRRYRLPTEAEWEFAARGSTQTAYWWGDEADKKRSNCDGCGSRWDGKSTAPVGSFKPNPFGLYDVTGNVWEWVCSGYHQTYNGSELECLDSNTVTNQHIVVRGGSWLDLPRDVRLAARLRYGANTRNSTLGFRLAVD